jgi:LMBR1 domain-containing protein 1
MQAVFRPVKLIGGILILILALVIFGSMIKTGVDKIIHSPCGKHCGYILDVNYGANPVDALLTVSSKAFPVDYVLVIILVLIFFASTIVGMTFIGIRFLWVTIFKFRKSQTPPQALLIATVMLTLMTLAINYAIVEFIAPRYSVYGSQAYCSHSSKSCEAHSGFITPCVLSAFYSLTPEIRDLANEVCTPTIASTFLNRISLNYPFFGGLAFWTQFVFLGVFLITVIAALIRTPTTGDVDTDTEEAEEEEGLLAGTRRRFGATWEDITGRARGRGADAENGRSGRPSGLEEGHEHDED